MKRTIIVLTLSIAGQATFTAAHASEPAKPIIEEVFESTFLNQEQPQSSAPAPTPVAPEQAPEQKSDGPVQGESGGSLTTLPDLSLPESSSVQLADGAGEPAESAPAPTFAPAKPSTREQATSRPGAFRVNSTAYCLTGAMASGMRVYYGAVAMNGVPFGTRYEVLTGPRAGETLVVEDRIGSGSGFDVAYPGNCQAAYNYGRRSIVIRKV